MFQLGNGFSVFLLVLGMVSFGNLESKAALHIKRGPLAHTLNEVIVKTKASSEVQSDSTSQFLSRAQQILGLGSIESSEIFKTDSSLRLVKLRGGTTVEEAVEAFSADPEVVFAEPNFIYTALQEGAEIPNDPQFWDLWGMQNRGLLSADTGVTSVWAHGITGSRDVVVAVIDTGVEWEHPDLVENLYVNSEEIPGNDVDDDGNGFIDDVHGWNFVDDTADSRDDQNHGTHCAGTIGAQGNNGQGVVGVNWNVSILPVKFLSARGGGTAADAVNAINYATAMRVDVMSNSWGGPFRSQAIREAVENAEKAGILFIAAAGNSGMNNDHFESYPANYEFSNVVSVAATTREDTLPVWTNRGYKKVHIAAPGHEILSTVREGEYAVYSGTSMATPHVAGAAALLKSVYPDWSYRRLKRRLLETAAPVEGLRREVAMSGRLNIANAIFGYYPAQRGPSEEQWVSELMTIQTPHPYASADEWSTVIEREGVEAMRFVFSRIDVETNFDFIVIEDEFGNEIERITGSYENYVSDYVPGNQARIRLETDAQLNDWGFLIEEIQVVPLPEPELEAPEEPETQE